MSKAEKVTGRQSSHSSRANTMINFDKKQEHIRESTMKAKNIVDILSSSIFKINTLKAKKSYESRKHDS